MNIAAYTGVFYGYHLHVAEISKNGTQTEMKSRWLVAKTCLCFIVGVFVAISVCPDADGQQRTLTPQAILKKTAEVYASCSSFQDVGLVVTTFEESTGQRVESQPFKLFFSRPTRFRFEWVDFNQKKNGLLNVVWSNGEAAFTYWEPDRYEKTQSLKLGIAGASGVSSGAAHTMPSLLMPQMRMWAVTDLSGSALVGDQFNSSMSPGKTLGLRRLHRAGHWLSSGSD